MSNNREEVIVHESVQAIEQSANTWGLMPRVVPQAALVSVHGAAGAPSFPAEAGALVWAPAAHDVGLDHEIVSTTKQHKMFNIVTANELDTSFSVELDGFDYSYLW